MNSIFHPFKNKLVTATLARRISSILNKGILTLLAFVASAFFICLMYLTIHQEESSTKKQILTLSPYILQEYFAGDFRSILIHLENNGLFESDGLRVCDSDNKIVISTRYTQNISPPTECTQLEHETEFTVSDQGGTSVLHIFARRKFNFLSSFSFAAIVFLSLLILYSVIASWSSREMTKVISESLGAIPAIFERLLSGDSKLESIPVEFEPVANRTKEIITKLRSLEDQINLERINSSRAQLALQVAHDIRSPLSALNIAMDVSKGLPENHRALMRSAINRINEIANNLITSAKDDKITPVPDAVLHLPSLISDIVTEKRAQLKLNQNISIEITSGPFEVFVKGSSSNTKIAISNVLNNSIEALSQGTGHISISCIVKDFLVQMVIKDDGLGIAPDILDKIGQQGFFLRKI